MATINKKCLACGQKYSYCPSCSKQDMMKPSYYSTFCCEECATLWTTLTRVNMNLITKEDAKSTISALDLKPMESYAACVQRDYAKVMVEERKPRKSRKIEPIIPVEHEVVEEIVEPVIEAEPIVVAEPVEETHEVVTIENE